MCVIVKRTQYTLIGKCCIEGKEGPDSRQVEFGPKIAVFLEMHSKLVATYM